MPALHGAPQRLESVSGRCLGGLGGLGRIPSEVATNCPGKWSNRCLGESSPTDNRSMPMMATARKVPRHLVPPSPGKAVIRRGRAATRSISTGREDHTDVSRSNSPTPLYLTAHPHCTYIHTSIHGSCLYIFRVLRGGKRGSAGR